MNYTCAVWSGKEIKNNKKITNILIAGKKNLILSRSSLRSEKIGHNSTYVIMSQVKLIQFLLKIQLSKIKMKVPKLTRTKNLISNQTQVLNF